MISVSCVLPQVVEVSALTTLSDLSTFSLMILVCSALIIIIIIIIIIEGHYGLSDVCYTQHLDPGDVTS